MVRWDGVGYFITLSRANSVTRTLSDIHLLKKGEKAKQRKKQKHTFVTPFVKRKREREKREVYFFLSFSCLPTPSSLPHFHRPPTPHPSPHCPPPPHPHFFFFFFFFFLFFLSLFFFFFFFFLLYYFSFLSLLSRVPGGRGWGVEGVGVIGEQGGEKCVLGKSVRHGEL